MLVGFQSYFSDIFLDQLRTNDSDETGVCAIGNCTSTQRFPSTRGAKEQNPLRRIDSKTDKLLGLQNTSSTYYDELLK
jgi:hypothetical protein